MGRMQHAAMIGSNASMADSLVGGGINTASAIGSPLAMGGLAMAGLDPVSLGLRAGMGASGMGMGMAGAGAIGLGAAGLAGAGLMGIQYAGSQMVQGAQQQQQLSQQLNSTFRFQNNIGTTGFTRGGVGDIGTMMRQMTTEQGGAGQMVGFEELGRLASNMGRMGMGQGVRDAKDFSDKFREMIKSVKEIAEQMGTSLEEAQKMMSAMRGSGIFGGANASMVSQRIRSGSVAGGLATSELTGMMQVGSQISRMVGGRGRAGAMGGLESITNIGVAQQLGIISEEDIYNATGLTGAEGRRAMATQQMQQSARFLRGGLGRRFLAAVAGQNGELDDASVEEMMSGAGTGRTMSMAHRNLGRVGRANFIRNEGRLRGAALERFGGLAPMIAMKGWLEQRGIDVNEDQDRAMVFMQRRLGMGNDESEMMLRQVRELPRILRQRQTAGEDDAFMRKEQMRRSQVGLEGVKRKFEKARADVQATLQQVGADFSESMGNMVEETINRMTDTRVRRIRQDVAGGFRAAMGGGALGSEAAASMFGLGGGSLASGAAIGGGSSRGRALLGDFMSTAKGPGDIETFQSTDAERFSEAGFGFSGGDLQAHLRTVRGISSAFSSGGEGISGFDDIQALGKANRRAFTTAMGSERGFARLDKFGEFLGGLSGGGGLARRFSGAGREEQAQIMAAFSGRGGAGVRSEAGRFRAPQLLGQYGFGGFRSQGQSARELGRSFAGGNVITNMLSEDIGQQLQSKEFTGILQSVFSRDASRRDAAISSVQEQLADEKDKLDQMGFFAPGKDESRARIKALQGTVAAAELAELRASGASDEEIAERAQALGTRFGVSREDVLDMANAVQGQGQVNEMQARRQAVERFGGRARESIDALRKGGLVTGTGENLRLSKAAAGKVSGAGQRVLQAMLAEKSNLAGVGVGSDDAAKEAALGRMGGLAQSRRDALGGMSVTQMRELAGSLRGTAGTSEIRGDLLRTAGLGERLQKGGARSAIGALGINMGKGEVQDLLASGGVDALTQDVVSRMGEGAGDNKQLVSQLKDMLQSVVQGKGVQGAVKLDSLLGNEEVQNLLKKLKTEAERTDPNKNLEKMGQMAEYITGVFKTNISEQTKALGQIAEQTKGFFE